MSTSGNRRGAVSGSLCLSALVLGLLASGSAKAGTTDRKKIRDALREVCCSPDGEVIEPGEWAKAKAAIAAGKTINYEGASGNCDFDENGDVKGVYGHYEIENGAFKLVEMLKP